MSSAVLKNAWDDSEGYFGYVLHDQSGYLTGILRYENEKNYNMGLDGVMPLIAGICTEEQQNTILGHITSSEHLWTDCGITTVDRSAPYYSKIGYWNGDVWMPHQWFIWKTMLDLGQPQIAYKIAKTALDIWKRETDESYNCMEHFTVESGRGAGWHQFSALSTPVMIWFAVYHIPGRITVGFDSWIEDSEFSNDNTSFSADIRTYGNQGKKCCAILNMNPNYKYTV